MIKRPCKLQGEEDPDLIRPDGLRCTEAEAWNAEHLNVGSYFRSDGAPPARHAMMPHSDTVRNKQKIGPILFCGERCIEMQVTGSPDFVCRCPRPQLLT